MGKIIDLTMPIETNMPTCGTPWHQSVEISQLGHLSDVGRNTSRIILGSHSGTHMDAPLHFVEEGNSIEQLDLSVLCGQIDIIDFSNRKKDVITEDDFENKKISKRILLRYGWNKWWKTDRYYKGYPYLSIDAAKYLLERGVELIAMDTPSPDNGDDINKMEDSPVHKLFLNQKVIIVEYLTNTEFIDLNKNYEIIALPLKLSGSDGSPSRVILREID